jgi:hypothetical protein
MSFGLKSSKNMEHLLFMTRIYFMCLAISNTLHEFIEVSITRQVTTNCATPFLSKKGLSGNLCKGRAESSAAMYE